ncbi:MAG TPA: hypothetical protein VFO19_13850 [Vicinamibacterales bacterium]|nr:hypothetical protein [Vicinamibacterales bacterium]
MALAALTYGCDDNTLPTAPTDLTEGVVIYEHANFMGRSAHLTSDVRNLRDFDGPCAHGDGDDVAEVWDDCASSIRVAPGWRAILYVDDDFDGQQLTVTTDVENLVFSPGTCDKGGFNDCTTSIRVTRPTQ